MVPILIVSPMFSLNFQTSCFVFNCLFACLVMSWRMKVHGNRLVNPVDHWPADCSLLTVLDDGSQPPSGHLAISF